MHASKGGRTGRGRSEENRSYKTEGNTAREANRGEKSTAMRKERKRGCANSRRTASSRTWKKLKARRRANAEDYL